MTDYIKREDILDRTVKRNSIWNGITNACGQGLEEIVNGIPSADVAPVVRCGDCLFCQMELGEGSDEPWCDIHGTTVDTEMFCSWGIRKDNG